MKIGYFDRNTGRDMCPLYKYAEEEGISLQYIDKLSYLGAKAEDAPDDPLDLDVLIVNPTLNRVQWENLLECVQKNPQIKFIFFLTHESAEDFEQDGFSRFPNVESYIEFNDKYERFNRLLEEAKQS
ncbi:MAG: hypothetical protein WCT16_00730 [Candidatus Buchananbacteria bacterium]